MNFLEATVESVHAPDNEKIERWKHFKFVLLTLLLR
jgi:hypothetical protein